MIENNSEAAQEIVRLIEFPGIKVAPDQKKKSKTRKKLSSDSEYKSNGIRKSSPAEPIRSPEDYKKICDYLLNNGIRNLRVRNYCLFVIGCDLGLRISDLLKLTVDMCFDKNGIPVSKISMIDKKTNKRNNYVLVTSVGKNALLMWKQEYWGKHEYIFFSNKSLSSVDPSQVWRMLNNAAKAIGLTGTFGTHSLRKTYGYQSYQAAKEVGKTVNALELLQTKYNHTDQRTTMRYACISEDEIRSLSEAAAKRLNTSSEKE